MEVFFLVGSIKFPSAQRKLTGLRKIYRLYVLYFKAMVSGENNFYISMCVSLYSTYWLAMTLENPLSIQSVPIKADNEICGFKQQQSLKAFNVFSCANNYAILDKEELISIMQT